MYPKAFSVYSNSVAALTVAAVDSCSADSYCADSYCGRQLPDAMYESTSSISF